MKINSNTTAVITNNYLTRAENALSKSSKRLSSGYKLNHAEDNPSGYAISAKMKAQLRSIEKAQDNSADAVNFLETGEGALAEIQDMVQRMNELCVKSANGTMTSADRDAIQAEINELSAEIERTAKTVQFNDQPILDGTFELKGYTNDINVKVMGYSDETKTGKYNFDFSAMVADADGNYSGTVTAETEKGNKLAPTLEGTYDQVTGILKVESNDGTEVSFNIADKTFPPAVAPLEVDLTGMGSMRIQVGVNEGDILSLNIPEISLKKMGIEGLNVSQDTTDPAKTAQENAQEAIEKVAGALDYVSAVRSKFGAYENRLEHTIANLNVNEENLTASFSTLVDTDMAAEMTEYTRLQVLQQAGTSMLAQANQFPQEALQLLQ